MTKSLLLSLALALPAAAGTSYTQQTVSEPASAPGEWNWFLGGSAGWLFDFEEVLYSGHIGVDTPWSPLGFDVALYAEVGYTQKEEDVAIIGGPNGETSLEIIPITFNVKFERPIVGNLNFYVGAGAGVAITETELDLNIDTEFSEDDTVFAFQAFAGLIYNFTSQFEIYAGARYLHLDDFEDASGGFFADVDGFDVEFEDDISAELGLRFTF